MFVNFLRFWTSPSSYPDGADDVPVTWISFDEAKDFCEFYGRRLPVAVLCWKRFCFFMAQHVRPTPPPPNCRSL